MSQDDIITGYQYSPETQRYIGTYSFPNNLDKEDIHLPPNTVLVEPPLANDGEEVFWDGGAWSTRPSAVLAQRPTIGNYSLVSAATIAQMKSQGMWTKADQVALESAREGEENHGD